MTANEKDFELSYWGDCCNTFHEEQKQYVYARLKYVREAVTSLARETIAYNATETVKWPEWLRTEA